ncbi:VOC family protein [Dysgonomonas sp. OttesenSCG-928-M03]|nr:VOC family protein [Dysgonomonas sp. OttesenSCG-928-M03]
MKLSKIHHIAIICSDYEKSKDFYTRILGLEIIEETYRAGRDSYKLDLAIGNHTRIELFSFPNAPERVSYPEARGLRHIAFATKKIDDVIAQLSFQGVQTEPIRIDEITGKKFTFFFDPDGLPIELYEE